MSPLTFDAKASRRRRALVAAAIIIAVAVYVAWVVRVPYRIKATAVFMPAVEFTLSRTEEGHLVSTFRDNVNNVVDSYGVTQFERGDVVEFVLADELAHRERVEEGEVLGTLRSDLEHTRLRELIGEMEVLEAQLADLAAGRKPEEVRKAKEEWELARQELRTQEVQTSRIQRLRDDALISDEEYELAENELRVREIAARVAQAQYLSTVSGEKPETVRLIEAQIEAVRDQIDQVAAKIERFTITSPVSGTILLPYGETRSLEILTIADDSQWVSVMPIRLRHRAYLEVGQEVSYGDKRGKLTSVGGRVTSIANQQAVQATALWPSDPRILPGSVRDVVVRCRPVTLMVYALRAMGIGKVQ